MPPSAPFHRRGSQLRRALLGLFLVLQAGLSACGGGDTKEPSAPQSASGLAQEIETLSTRYLRACQHPWKVYVAFIDEVLIPYQTRLVAFAMRARADGGANFEALRAEAAQLLQAHANEFQRPLQHIETVAPTADRLHNHSVSLQSLFRSLAVPQDVPFGLRDRYQEGWSRSVLESFRMLSDGLSESLRDKDSARMKIAIAGLERGLKEGAPLFEEVNALVRAIQVGDGAEARNATHLAYAERVLAAAAAPPEGVRIAEGEREALESAVQGVKGARPQAVLAWKSARSSLIEGVPAAAMNVERAQQSFEALRNRFLKSALDLGRRLQLKDPD